ncbi:hypothetical protein [Nonomuraea sediminis]|uniref:hypothetical protein n=1 Tax=Nonomuraea sediminis TaxID=2835864 RepID=UPI001BDBF7A2|nr:hypothetical protein [Nonomuraea sediminis]
MGPRLLPPALVIDPSLPSDVVFELRAAPHLLRMARTGRRIERTYSPTLPLAVLGFMVVLWFATGGPGPMVISIVVALFMAGRWASVDAANRSARRRLKLAYDYAAHYVLPEDLDHPCQMLLRRAQDAVEIILSSQVNRAGFIDTINNQVTLPEEVWQIAQRLTNLSRMHAEHSRLVPRNVPSGMEEAFRPYTSALDAAWTSLSKRVRQLERYAKQVQRADRVFHAHQRLDALVARTPEYQALVADTLRDDLARAHIKELAEQAAGARRLFEESIARARETAGELLRNPLS